MNLKYPPADRYRLLRDEKGRLHCTRVVDDPKTVSLPLNARVDLMNYSSDGFEVGYDGPKPMQLALAILADALGDNERAVALHEAFRKEWIVSMKLDMGAWMSIPREEIVSWARTKN